MTLEARPSAYGNDEVNGFAAEPLALVAQPENADAKRDTVVFVGAGQNTAHMRGSIGRLAAEHPVHVFEISEPKIPVPAERLHRVNTPEGQKSAAKLIQDGVHAVYGSLVPSQHLLFLKEYLQHADDGNVDCIVIAKPAVQNIQEMRVVDSFKSAAEKLNVHEHYKEKGAWHALREQLGEVTERLGRLSHVTIEVKEARTAEEEGRTAAFSGGALEDLGPHVISLAWDIQNSINATGRYTIPNNSQGMEIKRFRYDDSELGSDVETAFTIQSKTRIIDKADGSKHDLEFNWTAGKGLIDRKDVVLEFEHPKTHKPSIVKVDLWANKLQEVPEAVKDLFPQTEFDDNGYGYVVEMGLNGGDPRKSFQSWDEHRVIIKWMHTLAKRKGDLSLYPRGTSLQDLTKLPESQ